MKSIIVFAVLLIGALLFYLAIKHYSRQLSKADVQFSKLPSGKLLPQDSEIVCLSKEELEAYGTDDLAWLENYALLKKKEANMDIQITMWDDLLRRIDVAMNGF